MDSIADGGEEDKKAKLSILQQHFIISSIIDVSQHSNTYNNEYCLLNGFLFFYFLVSHIHTTIVQLSIESFIQRSTVHRPDLLPTYCNQQLRLELSRVRGGRVAVQ